MKGPYREPAPAPPDPYATVWQKLAWRRRVSRVLVLLVFFAFVAPALSFAPFVDGPLALIAMAVALAIPAALVVLSAFPPVACPRCESPFFSSEAAAIGSRASCSSCELAIGTPAAEAAAAQRLRASARAAHPPGRLRAVLWLGASLLSAIIGFEFGKFSSQPSSFIVAVSIAAFVTSLAAWGMKSRAFPRSWLVPIAALFFASLVGSGFARTRQEHMIRRPEICAPRPREGPAGK